MALPDSRDLGHGVRVAPSDGTSVVVLSDAVVFDWRPRSEESPGSAVLIDGESFEVIEFHSRKNGGRWRLERWAGEDVMRQVFTLDESSVSRAFAAGRASAEADRIRPWLIACAPILGFATAERQRRWRDRFGFPAFTATWSSAILEMLFGAACVVELVASGAGGVSVFPWIPRPVLVFGLILFVEGIVRLAQVFADTEPIGSVFGLVFAAFTRPRAPIAPPRPRVGGRRFSDSPGLAKTVLLSIACTIAPGRFQERWGWWVGTKAIRFTIFGAIVEIFGSLINLNTGAAVQPGALVVNLYFVFEGVVRLGWVVLRDGPLGSVIGLPLTPLLEKVLPE
jgi:hypothetical protein